MRIYSKYSAGSFLLFQILAVACGGSDGFHTVVSDENAQGIPSNGDDPEIDVEAPGGDVAETGTPICLSCSPGSEGESLGLTSDTYIQPSGGTRPLDVLLVVDNSGSMGEEQAKLANLGPLLDYIQNVDWRLAVVSTDMGDASFRETIDGTDASTSFAQKKVEFSNAILGLGTNGSGNEKGITKSYEAVNWMHPTLSESWVRNDSHLAIIVVSDEDECSTGGQCGVSNQELIDRVANDHGKAVDVDFRFSSLVRPDAGSCPQAYNIGTRYTQMSSATNGLVGEICAASYDNTLESIGANLAVAAESAFELNNLASEIISVEIDGDEFLGQIQFSNNIVILDPPPGEGAEVVIKYQYAVED